MSHTDKKHLLTWSLVGIGFILFLALLSWFGTKSSTPYSGNTQTVSSEINPDDVQLTESIDVTTEHVKGNPEANITLVEYSDFQCPACASAYPVLKQVVETYNADVRLVYRHFPLRQIHPNAQLAAQASEAAANQGKFYEMHDALFNTQSQWSAEQDPTELFVKLAESIGLDATQFQNDLVSTETASKVNEDFSSAAALTITGTPTIFLNGQKTPLISASDLGSKIEELIGEKSGE